VNCDEFVELVTEFLDGSLDDETAARFVDHISVCDGCEAYLGQVQGTVTRLADLPADDRLPDQARERLLDAFRKRPHG
jgi:anti-sigma factor RsiW